MKQKTKPQFNGKGTIKIANINTPEEFEWMIREMIGQNAKTEKPSLDGEYKCNHMNCYKTALKDCVYTQCKVHHKILCVKGKYRTMKGRCWLR